MVRALILGASGVFGSRLVERAAREPGLSFILAGRTKATLEALAARCCPTAEIRLIDRDRIEAADLAGADLIIDAAGPFQGSHSRVIEAALGAGVDYIDLADGRAFVAGITAFDERAKAAGVSIVSGASTIPAMSHAVLDSLTLGWQAVNRIKVGIFPGNRAPRGRAVVEAILSYAGKPLRIFRGGIWKDGPGWGDSHRWAIAGVGTRWASICDTPDQDLLVSHYQPLHSAEFYAGLELSILHLGLSLASLTVRAGLIDSLRPAAPLFQWIATQFLRFGSDIGAMEISVDGVDSSGKPAVARWTLRADGNRGPYVPALPGLILLRSRRDNGRPAPGARPCLQMISLDDFQADFVALGIATSLGGDHTADQGPTNPISTCLGSGVSSCFRTDP
jgi:Saccharopine dehydrogenase NADP binding domain